MSRQADEIKSSLKFLHKYATNLPSFYEALQNKIFDEDEIILGRYDCETGQSEKNIFLEITASRNQVIQDKLVEGYEAWEEVQTEQNKAYELELLQSNPHLLSIVYSDFAIEFIYGDMRPDLQNLFPRDIYELKHEKDFSTVKTLPELLEGNPAVFNHYLMNLGSMIALEEHLDMNAAEQVDKIDEDNVDTGVNPKAVEDALYFINHPVVIEMIHFMNQDVFSDDTTNKKNKNSTNNFGLRFDN